MSLGHLSVIYEQLYENSLKSAVEIVSCIKETFAFVSRLLFFKFRAKLKAKHLPTHKISCQNKTKAK